MRMRLIPLLVVSVALTLAGCGDDDADPVDTSSAEIEATTTAPVSTDTTTLAADTTTTAEAETTTTAAPAAAAPTIDELLAATAPLNIAHAGGDLAHPHSTMFAYAESVAEGADVLELDVQLTADGVLVVQHDETVDKTTEATGPVGELTLDEIQALDNAYWFSPDCWPCQDLAPEAYVYRGVRTGDAEPPAGYTADDFRVATLREVAEAFPDLPLDIEIKGGEIGDPYAVADALAAALAELDRLESSVVVSFDSAVVAYFHEVAPEVEVSPGLDELTAWFLAGTPLAEHYRIIQIPPFFEQAGTRVPVITADLVARTQAEGLAVWAWMDDPDTQDNAAYYRELLDLGVPAILAGRPAELTDALAG